MSNYAIFAKRLKQLREDIGLTQKDFAKKIGCTQATLSSYENTPKNPSLDIVIDIAEKCEVSIDWLCGLSDKKSYKTYINTYSDIGILLLDISVYTGLNIESVIYQNEKLNLKCESTGIIFDDPKITEFLQKWKKIKELAEDKTIDNETYLNIMSGLFNTYNIPEQCWE